MNSDENGIHTVINLGLNVRVNTSMGKGEPTMSWGSVLSSHLNEVHTNYMGFPQILLSRSIECMRNE